jgi:hypothetical protein
MDYHDDLKMKNMHAIVQASTLDAAAAAAAAAVAAAPGASYGNTSSLPLHISSKTTTKCLCNNTTSSCISGASAWYPSSPTNSVTQHVNDVDDHGDQEEEEYHDVDDDDDELGSSNPPRKGFF